MTTGPAANPDESGSPRPPESERRASLALKAVAFFTAIAGLAVLATQTQPYAPVAYVVTVLAYGATAWFAATRIDARVPWALGTARILLAVLLGTGVIDFLAAAQQNVLRIPLGAVVAAWALAAPGSTPRIVGRDQRTAVAVVGIFVASSLVLSAGPLLSGPSSPFAATESDLALSLEVNCGAAGAAPSTVPITVRWSWTRGEPFASGIDGVAIGWDSDADEGADERYVFRPAFVTSAGVWSGGGEASGGDTNAFVASQGGGLTFGIELAEQSYAPGFVSITLDRASADAIAHGTLEVRAVYSHLGRWRANTRLIPPCTW